MSRHAHRSAATAFLAGAFACISLCWTALTLAQESSRQYDIDIGELPLTEALQAFSRQTGLQHGYLPTDEEEERMMVGPIEGRLTASEVLTKLLPSGFTFEWITVRMVSIVPPTANAPPGGVKEAVAGKDRQHSELAKEQQLSMANGGGKSGSVRGPYAFEGEMLVEASRISDTLDLDIPVTVFDQRDIEVSGVSTLADLMRYVTQQPYAMSESLLGDGTQVVNLRGLGFDNTLVLVNGRRAIGTASSFSVNAVDLNSIPLGAVERVEIVSDSMSAIHGADAIGGVLNIVLREDIPEPKLDLDYGAAAGGAVERHAAFGLSGSAGRARGSVVLDYFDRSPLLGRERDRWNNQDFTRFGGIDWRTTAASPGNVSSATLDNLPGLTTRFAAIPATSAGIGLAPSDFLATAGHQNLASLSRYQPIAYARTRKGVVAHGEYGIRPGMSAYGELLFVDRDFSAPAEPPALRGVLVPGTNPYNPFDADVLVDVLLIDRGPRKLARSSEMIRAGAGIRGQMRSWDWELSLHNGQDKDSSMRTNGLDPARVAAALSAAETHETLNMFGERNSNNPELLGSLLAAPSRNRSRTETRQATAYLRGPLFSLPAGSVDLVIGGEDRKESVQYDFGSPANESGSHQRTVTAAFGELRLPLIGGATKILAVHDLWLVLSARADDYSDAGTSLNPEYALTWRPIPAVSLRTSWSQSFRPPPLFDLYQPPVDVVAPTIDPRRNGELAFPIWRAGGNSGLEPSTADSLTTSIRFSPLGNFGLRMSATYWRIHVDETIGIPQASHLLAAESSFTDRVLRREPSDTDIAAGIPGPLELIDITRLNHGSVRTSGIDFNSSLHFETHVGRFKPDVTATWVHDYTTSDLVSGPGIRRVGVADLLGTIARWRAVASLNWSYQGFGAFGALRYIPSYDDVDLLRQSGVRKVSSQALVDMQLSMDLSYVVAPGSPWDGFELRAGVSNLFDDAPPFAQVGLSMGFDPSQGELKQRFTYFKLSKRF